MATQARDPFEGVTLSVGRDYRLPSGYEYVLFRGEDVIARAGGFRTASKARREGIKFAHETL